MGTPMQPLTQSIGSPQGLSQAVAPSRPFLVGERLVFLGYRGGPEVEPFFHRGQWLVVAAVDPNGSIVCFPTDRRGSICSQQGDTLFFWEVLRLPTEPLLQLPYPYDQIGDGGDALQVGAITA